MLATASEVERQLRQKIGQLVSAQVVEEEGEMRLRRGGNYHRFNAILRKVRGKARGEMTVAELQSTVSWLEQNRLVDFLDILRDDVGYEITARRREQRKSPHAGGWPPPASRQASHGLRTGSRGAPP
jgi:hypothetical protein